MDAIVAGHICLDVIPSLPAQEGGFQYRPGGLVTAGEAAVSTGGCVPNTGLALHRLGITPRLLGKLGDDAFGRIVRDMVAAAGPKLADGLLMLPDEHTSYSVILNPPGEDRMFLHFPGANDTFSGEEISDGDLEGARVFHFGYPPIMRKMYEGEGANLARLLRRAKQTGLTTSLDMSYVDPATPAGRVDWRRLLAGTLPEVDIFLPSLVEVRSMLEPDTYGLPAERVPVEEVARLGQGLIDMGAAVVGIKAGERGLYLRTSSARRLGAAGPAISDAAKWADRDLWSAAFDAAVVGTTGAGDAAVAGFLFGVLSGMSPEETVTAACAAGAASVEAADAVSGVRSWEQTRARIERGWQRQDIGLDWEPSKQEGVWLGPHDSQS